MGFTKIRDLLNEDRPREKLRSFGVKVLTDTELLAIVLRSGGKNSSAVDLAREIIRKFGGIKNLINTEMEELTEFNHIGIAKASSIKAACEIGLRTVERTTTDSYEIKKPEDIFWLLRKDLFDKLEENLYLVSLNTRNRFIAKDLLTIGGVNEAVANPREIFKKALARNAVSIILVHNHPSNDTQPSTEDIQITERVAKVGKELGVRLTDHVIVSKDSYSSMKALGMFESRKFT